MPTARTSISIERDEKVLIRSVTHYYVGRVVGTDDQWVALTNASWVASTGRFSVALATGSLDEVEPYPAEDTILVARGAIVDIATWNHDLPTAAK